MKILESEFDSAVEGELRDYHLDGLQEVTDKNKYLQMLDAMTPLHALEVIHFYKWMPPPDFDATSAPAVVQQYHANPRPSGADQNADPVLAANYERVKLERKINVAHAYKRRHGTWPVGLNVRGNHVTPAEARAWDANAFELYHQMGKDVVGQIKDKTIVSPSMQKELFGKKHVVDKSYLLWYMANAGNIDTQADLHALATGVLAEDNYVRSAYKPEAHKPDSRLFYMAPPRQRTLLGEFEGNLANMARYYPGSLMGKDTGDKARIISRIMDLDTDVDNLPSNVDTTLYVVTFDLTKFSPRSNPAVTKDYHDFWAKVYGKPELTSLYSIGCESTITHTTAGVIHQYKNNGCDLEGFRGKMMTMFHSDLLAAACRLARERGYIAGRSDLADFIDDGAVKVAVVAKGSGALARANAAAFLGTMQEIYASAGQDNNPSKTVVSSGW